MQEIPVGEHEGNDIGLFVAPLLEVDSERIGGLSNAGADRWIDIDLSLGDSGNGRGTNVCNFSKMPK